MHPNQPTWQPAVAETFAHDAFGRPLPHEPATDTSAAIAPRAVISAEENSLRERVRQENLNQSDVLASRRLDEALLRLDQAAGRKRGTPTSPQNAQIAARTSQDAQPAPGRNQQTNPASAASQSLRDEDRFRNDPPRYIGPDLELDASVAGSTAVWLETIEETRHRVEPPHAAGPAATGAAPHFSHAPPPESAAPTAHSAPVTTQPERKPAPQAERKPAPPVSPVSGSRSTYETFESMFGRPIDVMLIAETTGTSEFGTNDVRPSEPSPAAERSSTKQEPAAAPEQTTPSAPAVADEATTTRDTQAAAFEKAAIEKAAIEKAAIEKAAIEKAAIEKAAIEKAAIEKAAFEKAEWQASTLQAFDALWQVDRFALPSVVDELFLAGSVAQQLAMRLSEARKQGLRTIAVTSDRRGEGRSTVAMGISLSVATAGLKVALVDADREGVRLANDLHLDLDHSWIDAVRGVTPLTEVAVLSDADAVTLFPLLDRPGETPFQSRELSSLLAQLRQSFDVVIVDCGPASIDDVLLCDTALIVRDLQRTKAIEVETLTLSLRKRGLRGVGIVENFC